MTTHSRLTRSLVRPVPRGLRPRRPLAALAAWLLEESPGPAQRARIADALRFAPPH